MSVFTWAVVSRAYYRKKSNREAIYHPVQIHLPINEDDMNRAHQFRENSLENGSGSSNQSLFIKTKRISAGGLMTVILQTDGILYFCGRLGIGRPEGEIEHLSSVRVEIPSSDEVLEVIIHILGYHLGYLYIFFYLNLSYNCCNSVISDILWSRAWSSNNI